MRVKRGGEVRGVVVWVVLAFVDGFRAFRATGWGRCSGERFRVSRDRRIVGGSRVSGRRKGADGRAEVEGEVKADRARDRTGDESGRIECRNEGDQRGWRTERDRSPIPAPLPAVMLPAETKARGFLRGHQGDHRPRAKGGARELTASAGLARDAPPCPQEQRAHKSQDQNQI